jgi:cyclopropane fatty-acyl-phospholipid synthase-like methyltransferase
MQKYEVTLNKDFFEHKADIYDSSKIRVSNVENIANAIIGTVSLNRNMHLMDFGSGTGLLLERISPLVRKIAAIDISQSMNEQLNKKRGSLSCEIDTLQIDLESSDITGKFDGIISSMTMHHVKDVRAMFVKFYSMLNADGSIAISGLDKENGSFHTQDTYVHHCGFERNDIVNAATQAGFRELKILDVSLIHKPQGEYPVFLLTAKR